LHDTPSNFTLPLMVRRRKSAQPHRDRPVFALHDGSIKPAIMPVPGWLRRAVGADKTLAAQSLEDLAFPSGAVIAVLDAVVRRRARWRDGKARGGSDWRCRLRRRQCGRRAGLAAGVIYAASMDPASLPATPGGCVAFDAIGWSPAPLSCPAGATPAPLRSSARPRTRRCRGFFPASTEAFVFMLHLPSGGAAAIQIFPVARGAMLDQTFV
jgi:hypothetical protein